MIRSGDMALDAALAARGYDVIDPVNLYIIPAQDLAQTRPPKVCMFSVWPRLAIQEDIWARAGIGPARLAVMDRAQGPKTTILARWNDKPAGTAYAACHNHTAMLHALEILPAHQRQGLGRIVMNHAAFWALEQGMTHVATLCVNTNLPANGLYSSLGMKVVEHYHYRIKRT
jgi:GNAT superfamily N-acetyltransferase